MTTDKELKVVFAEGCFDEFEGTQEELDAMIAEIMAMAADGSIFDKSTSIDIDELDDDVLLSLANKLDKTRH